MRRFAVLLVAVPIVGLALLQFVPYGRDHSNPRVVAEPAWDSPRTRELGARACFDCHSNETQWPWYSNVAPVSWLVQQDVDEGRAKLNFSEWTRPQEEADEAADTVRSGEMPMLAYRVMHSHARLTVAERAELVTGLSRTLGDKEPGVQSERAEQDGENDD